MHRLMDIDTNIAIVGWSCRLPGASSIKELWQLLLAEKCSVSQIPPDRWALERFAHPRIGERGRSYTWAAGVLDDIWGFDPSAFGMTPREAEQMDPQQRLLLELTWEALEDAGIKPSEISGTDTGVFVGASALDHGQLRTQDIAAADAYFATGNTLSIVSNRISYVFNLNGPSLTIDTACSSALVALDEAVNALKSGRIETAIVGGVNILASPFGFIGFSQASMLSKSGLCQAFSAKADGYVRAEGAVVLVLKSQKSSESRNPTIHSLIIGTKVNSDGHTNGISLPSVKGQSALLKNLYEELDIKPDRLAFIEAHGTGTPVGDPIEAKAIGHALGVHRTAPLLIGSVKTNIGHTETVAGLVGLIKACLSLKHGIFPASLHCNELNPNIDFESLNLRVCTAALPLQVSPRPRFAGVNSFGFGGTNAHVILVEAPKVRPSTNEAKSSYLLLSAHSRAGLSALLNSYSNSIKNLDDEKLPEFLAAVAHRRDRLRERFVVPFENRNQLHSNLQLAASIDTENGQDFTIASALEHGAKIAFVYSGNGGQWLGMGLAAYKENKAFKARFDLIDDFFKTLSGWSLVDLLRSNELAEKLELTSVVQPIIFALQAATTYALKMEGLQPSIIFGHSVGEVAAAEAAGLLDLESAIRVIYFRSYHQERTKGMGAMAAVVASEGSLTSILEDLPGLEVAAYNNARAFTLAGDQKSITALSNVARRHKARVHPLKIDYPFHTRLMDGIKISLINDLACLQLGSPKALFISTVYGNPLSASCLDANYWWQNIRAPVLFSKATQEAIRLGARIFIEIGPDTVLSPHINSVADANGFSIAAINVHTKRNDGDAIRRAFAAAVAFGADVDMETSFGTDSSREIDLVSYPWQRERYRLQESSESTALFRPVVWHPLIGARLTPDKLDWHSTIDTDLVQALKDHKINGQVILPGAAFVEMALAIARDWLDGQSARIIDLEIIQPLILHKDSSREVLCHVEPDRGRIEISSRSRLGRTPWMLHAVAKILKDTSCAIPKLGLPEVSVARIAGEQIYKITDATGLQFGPLFRNLSFVSRIDENIIRVDLNDCVEISPFWLDPARLDSCFHGLVLLFADFIAKGQKTAFVPIRFGEINLLKPSCTIMSARIEIRTCNDRTIIADYILFDNDGDLVATLNSVRYQALPSPKDQRLTNTLILQNFVLATEPTAARMNAPLRAANLSEHARVYTKRATEDMPAAFVLMEGWATAVGWEMFQRCAENSTINISACVKSGQLPPFAQAWAENLLTAFTQSGLIAEGPFGWRLCEQGELPNQDVIFQTLAADHPEHSAELLLMAWTNAIVSSFGSVENQITVPQIPAAAIESFELGGVQQRAAASFLINLLSDPSQHWPKDRGLRILQLGYGPLSHQIVPLAKSKGAELTILEPDKKRLERARLFFRHGESVKFEDALEHLQESGFDLVIAADALYRIFSDHQQWPKLLKVFSADAVFCAVEPSPSLFRDTIFGLVAEWFRETNAGSFAGSIAGPAILSHDMAQAGLNQIEVEQIVIGGGLALLATGQFNADQTHLKTSGDISIIVDENLNSTAISSCLATLLTAAGMHVEIRYPNETLESQTSLATEFVFLSSELMEPEQSIETSLTRTCLLLKQFAEQQSTRKSKLWLVNADAENGRFDFGSEQAASLWALSRTFANEYPMFDLRRVMAHDMSPNAIAERLSQLILSTTCETDIILENHTTKVLRFEYPENQTIDKNAIPNMALRLERGLGTGLDRISWIPTERRSPKPEEVEIEVEATGLNFRDLMWGMGLLPEEVFERGFAGAALGLECAGRVLRVGHKVRALAPGDPVIAFAKHGFATHTTVPAAMVFRRPEVLTAEAAATIPVAFVTAYYSLISCARLKPREWVVIHSGAGGVGLAALQICLWRRARVIATASTPEKRALLRQLGAEHVFDSRSGTSFDDIREIVPDGVHVVLNSLSGEAMERSIGLLRPFGRFIELGKRDYAANTSIGLRPFHKNLTYFGVDLDQLVLHDRNTARNLFRNIIALFDKGHLLPLPYRSFASEETIDALRLMQHAGHIGKLVVLPPRLPEQTDRVARCLKIAADKTHLITGGLGGFGLETARWLVEKGARHIVLVGRNATVKPEKQALLAELAAYGASIILESCDIADKEAVKGLFARLKQDKRPLGGVFHEAMVLEDAIIKNLTEEKIERVLRPKVLGAKLLDEMTRNMDLDYFILFSSATTIIGNPGQAAYVMANGFIEGLARRRRKQGLPGLAVAWGAIDDVGVLAENQTVRDRLAKYSGVHGLKAREGLDLMVQALHAIPADAERAVIALAPIDWSHARQHLAVFKSPTYSRLPQGNDIVSGQAEQVDIKSLLAERPLAEVKKLIADEITDQIAHVLRLPRDDIARSKPLAEIGLDSLMAMELALAMEQRFGLGGSMMTSASGLTVLEVADHVIAIITESISEQERFALGVTERHLDVDLDPAALSSAKERLYEENDRRKTILS
jgi:acyl transferase domain-containing protein/NADPH:quinone reductase-like Zn-dependent oxidoreductase/acyl carrier protein